MEIPIDGEMTSEEIQRALALIFGPQRRTGGILAACGAVFALLSGLVSLIGGQRELFVLFVNVLPFTVLVLVLGGILWWMPRSQARKYQGSPLFQGRVTGVVTGEVLELRSEQSEGKTRWAAFVQYRMSDEVVLLFQNQAAAMIVPRGFFGSDEDWQRFREHVRAIVPDKAKAQGGILRWGWLVYAVITLIVIGVVLSGVLCSR